MNVIFMLIKAISSIISLYTLLIFIRVMLTWVPSLAYSKFGRILAEICDPYLNWFRRCKILRTASIDFTPILAIGVLVIISSILQNFALTQRFSIGILLAIIIQICWSVVSSFLTILNILIAIRLVFNLLNKDSGSRLWAQIDQLITPAAYKITGVLFPRKYIKYRTVLICTLCALIIIQFGGGLLIGTVSRLLQTLPF